MSIRLMTSSALILAAAWIVPSRVAAQCGGIWTLRTPATAPTARALPGMVYDSDRKVTVLFGGETGSTANDETWEWDGTTWGNKSPAAAPAPRYDQGMAYDSKRKVTVLFGGFDGTTFFGDTWEWNGTQWTQRTPAASPSGRYFATMDYDSDRGVTVLFGGYDGVNILFDTWEWDGTNWTNKSVSPHPEARAAHMMTYDTVRKAMIVFGGILTGGSTPTIAGDTWAWDGVSWTQRLTVQSPTPRIISAMDFDEGRGKVLLFGGADLAANTGVDESWEWDGSDWTMVTPGVSPSGRYGGGMVYDSQRLVSVYFGGSTGGAQTAETWEWDIPTIQITQQPTAQTVSDGQTAGFTVAANSGAVKLAFAWRHNGTPLVDGGSISGATTPTLTINPVKAADAGDYDVQVSHACQTVDSKAAALNISSSGAASDTSALTAAPCGLCGGGTAMMMPLSLLGLGRARRWTRKTRRRQAGDDQAGSTRKTSRKCAGARECGIGWAGRVIGIFLVLAASASRAQAQCGGTWTLLTPAAAPSPRSQSGMAYDSGRGVTVLFGGNTNGGTNNETWEWDGTNWTQKFPAATPGSRGLQGMTYDSNRHVTVMFGGASHQIVSDETWEWDGTNWTRRAPAESPPARAAGLMAFDVKRNVSVLFGGLFIDAGGDVAIFGDTWEWDGTQWKERFSVAAPGIRAAQGMCFDSGRGDTVLFGGLFDINNLVSNETFEWDGTNWVQRIPATVPPSRDQQAMAFDSVHGVTVQFGGQGSASTALGDTWEWDGTVWRERLPAVAPTARVAPSAVFDSKRGVTVLFGGTDSSGLVNDTWEWTGPGPTITQQPASQSVVSGQSASFTVVGDGGLPVSFHWRKNSIELTDGGGISGSLTSTLTINPATAANAGTYDVEVSNSCGTVTSVAVTLDACKAFGSEGDCNGNGILDSCDIAANPALDANGNDVLDSCETAAPQGSQAVPCGLCGGGSAMMMPLTLLGWTVARARRRD